MQILVSIDDTDNLESRGTGELAAMLARDLTEKDWGSSEPVTRHQMLVHPDIPYTSHNSAMCFAAQLGAAYFNTFSDYAQEFLRQESAQGSDPGLCIVDLEKLSSPQEFIAFGYKAKSIVLTKEEAYGLARRLNIHLSEHGGSGQGVIGALAGAALRLTRNDGRFRGHLKIETDGDTVSVSDILQKTYVEIVRSLDGDILQEHEVVKLGNKVKAVLLEGKTTLPVVPLTVAPGETARWQTCAKEQFRRF